MVSSSGIKEIIPQSFNVSNQVVWKIIPGPSNVVRAVFHNILPNECRSQQWRASRPTELHGNPNKLRAQGISERELLLLKTKRDEIPLSTNVQPNHVLIMFMFLNLANSPGIREQGRRGELVGELIWCYCWDPDRVFPRVQQVCLIDHG